MLRRERFTCFVHHIYKVNIHNFWLPIFLSHLFCGSKQCTRYPRFLNGFLKSDICNCIIICFSLILYMSSIIPNALLGLLVDELHALLRDQSRMIPWSLPCIVAVPTMHKNRNISPLYSLICIIAAEFHCSFISRPFRILGCSCTPWSQLWACQNKATLVSSAESFSWLHFLVFFLCLWTSQTHSNTVFFWN